MSEKEIIDEVFNALTTDFSDDYKVELFPDNPQTYVLQHPKGAILVKGSNISSDTPNMRQNIDIVGISITLLLKSLNYPDNIYTVSDSIRTTISSLWIGGMFHIYQLSRNEPIYDFENEWWEREIIFISPQVYKMGDD